MYKNIAVFAFSAQGIITGERIREALEKPGGDVGAWAPARLASRGWMGFSTLAKELEELFLKMDAFVFVGAAGIAVRAVAPFIRDKLHDPAVVVVDELGRFVIPVLSGHAGGANELARRLGAALEALPVITTATDLHDVFSVDTFARRQGLSIVEKDEIKHLSGALLAGEPIGALTPECGFLISPYPVGKPLEHTLHLVPQDLVVGMGCKKGVPEDVLAGFLSGVFEREGWSLHRIRAIASVDAKREEPGLTALARRLHVPFLTYAGDLLAAQQGDFSSSEFVRGTVGVDNVCERGALCAAVEEGWLPAGSRFEDFCRLGKEKGGGMTLAVLAICRKTC